MTTYINSPFVKEPSADSPTSHHSCEVTRNVHIRLNQSHTYSPYHLSLYLNNQCQGSANTFCAPRTSPPSKLGDTIKATEPPLSPLHLCLSPRVLAALHFKNSLIRVDFHPGSLVPPKNAKSNQINTQKARCLVKSECQVNNKYLSTGVSHARCGMYLY